MAAPFATNRDNEGAPFGRLLPSQKCRPVADDRHIREWRDAAGVVVKQSSDTVTGSFEDRPNDFCLSGRPPNDHLIAPHPCIRHLAQLSVPRPLSNLHPGMAIGLASIPIVDHERTQTE